MDELMRAINTIIDEGSVNYRGGRARMAAEIRLSVETYVASEIAKARSEWDPECDGPTSSNFQVI